MSSPHWDDKTSSDELQQAEKDSFLEWRRELAQCVTLCKLPLHLSVVKLSTKQRRQFVWCCWVNVGLSISIILSLKAGGGTEVNSHTIWEKLGVLETTVESHWTEVKMKALHIFLLTPVWHTCHENVICFSVKLKQNWFLSLYVVTSSFKLLMPEILSCSDVLTS